MDTNICGASNLYLEATGSNLGRDTGSLLMLFTLSRFDAGSYEAVRADNAGKQTNKQTNNKQ
jgi:hypothetical protein